MSPALVTPEPGAPPQAAAAARWPLIGRDDELALVDVAARSGPVIIAGAPGVGKTRLAADWAARRSGPTVRVMATRSSATVPFGAFAPWAPAGLDGTGDRLATMAAIADHLGDLAPDTITIDDAHELDDASAALLMCLATTAPGALVITLRSAMPCPDPITALWKDGIGTRIDLRPLSHQECSELLDHRLGGRVHSATEQRLWALSAGNPMYLREVTEAALEEGRLVEARGVWTLRGALPGTPRLIDLVEARIGRVDLGERTALEVLALGEPLPVAIFSSMLPEHDIARLESAGLVAVSDHVDETVVGLCHPLYGEVLRTTIPVLRTRDHLRALAAAALEHGMDRTDPLRVARWIQGSGGVAEDVELLVSAATLAIVLQDHALALELATAAVDLGGGTSALLAQARVLGLLGEHQALEVLLASAGTAAASPAEEAEVAQLRVIARFWGDRTSTTATTLVDEAIATLPPVEGAGVAVTGACAALLCLDLDRARTLAATTITVKGVGPGPLVTARTIDAWATVLQGRPSVLLGEFDDLVPVVVERLAADPLPAAFLSTGYALASILTGRLDHAEALLGSLVADEPHGSDRVYQALPLLLLAQVALMAGRVHTAEARAHRALELMGEDQPYVFGRPVAAGGVAAAAAAQAGDVGVCERVLDRIGRRGDLWVPEVRVALDLGMAWSLAASRGEAEGAQAALAAADRVASAPGLEVQPLLDATRLGAADRTASRLAALADHVEGPLVAAAAELACALAAHDGPRLDHASSAFEAIGANLVAAEAAHQAALAHGRSGLRRAEATSQRRALELLVPCEGAATPLLVGVDHAAAASLTGREREVAALAAGGRSNREVAIALGVSVRTVNSHLNHAYAKLGTSDRGELTRLLGSSGSIPE